MFCFYFPIPSEAHGADQQRSTRPYRGGVPGPQRRAKQPAAVAVRTSRPSTWLHPAALQPAPAAVRPAGHHATDASPARLDPVQRAVRRQPVGQVLPGRAPPGRPRRTAAATRVPIRQTPVAGLAGKRSNPAT